MLGNRLGPANYPLHLLIFEIVVNICTEFFPILGFPGEGHFLLFMALPQGSHFVRKIGRAGLITTDVGP